MIIDGSEGRQLMRRQKSQMRELLFSKQVPLDKRRKVLAFLDNYFRKKTVFAEQTLMDTLPDAMRRDLYSHFYESTFLASVPLFRGLPADMQMELSMALRPLSVQPGEDILAVGMPSNDLYVIQDGRVKKIVQSDSGPEVKGGAKGSAAPSDSGRKHESVVTLSKGSFFGEECILSNEGKAQATYVAITHCDLSFVNSKILQQMAAHHPTFRSKLAKFGRMREERQKKKVAQSFRKAQLLFSVGLLKSEEARRVSQLGSGSWSEEKGLAAAEAQSDRSIIEQASATDAGTPAAGLMRMRMRTCALAVAAATAPGPRPEQGDSSTTPPREGDGRRGADQLQGQEERQLLPIPGTPEQDSEAKLGPSEDMLRYRRRSSTQEMEALQKDRAYLNSINAAPHWRQNFGMLVDNSRPASSILVDDVDASGHPRTPAARVGVGKVGLPHVTHLGAVGSADAKGELAPLRSRAARGLGRAGDSTQVLEERLGRLEASQLDTVAAVARIECLLENLTKQRV